MNLSIGLSGLRAAQQAIELIGTNLANAATEGYHRQSIVLSPVESTSGSTRVSTGGVTVEGSSRSYDVLIEREIYNVLPELGAIEQELSVLTTIESVIGNVDNDPLSQSLSHFFSALSDLSSDPTQSAYAQDVVWSADSMCTILNSLGDYLTQLRNQLVEQAQQCIEEVNTHAQTIANLNKEIEMAMDRGTSANLLKDQRDQAIAELASLVNLDVGSLVAEDGQVNVSAWGTPLVVSEIYQSLAAGVNDSGELGISVDDLENYSSYISGGKIGALANLYNELIPEMQDQLNTLAKQIMWEFNNIHAQGVGLNGSFTELEGVPVNRNDQLKFFEPPVSDGTLCVRFTDPDGNSSVHEIHIEDTMYIGDVIDQINLIDPDNLSANLSDGAIYMQAGNGYSFDFLPTFSETATAATEILTGRAVLNVSKDYFTGDNAADLLTFNLGTTAAEQFIYAIGNDSKTLYEAVQDINAWSQSVHEGWQAASAVWDDTAGGFVLKLNAYDYTSAGNISVINTGAVKWSGTTNSVLVAAGNFERTAARDAFPVAMTLSGIYTGQNQTYTCKVSHPDGAGATGQVGVEDSLAIEVYNEDSELVKVLSVGLGYAAGDQIEVENGILISFGTGTLTDGDEFTFTARSESDDTMFLAAAGLNTFFKGDDASNIAVRDEFYTDPQQIAASMGVEMGDNANVARMLSIQKEGLAGLGGSTPDEFYNNMITSLGQRVLLCESRQETLDTVRTELLNQRDKISGVDTNEEAAKLLVYERMFQAMSKFITTQNDMLEDLMNIL